MAEHPNTSGPDGLWLTITELAERKGVGKPTISERVSRFEARGLITTRPGKGKAKLVNLAEYDRVAGEVTDLAREQGAATRRQDALPAEPTPLPSPGAAAGTDPVYTREQARKMAYSADREKIALGEALKVLVPVDRLAEEAQLLFAPMVSRLDRLESRADEVAVAVGRDGVAGGRAWLKTLKIEIRNDIAAGLSGLIARLSTEPERDLASFNPSLADGAPTPQPEPDD